MTLNVSSNIFQSHPVKSEYISADTINMDIIAGVFFAKCELKDFALV